MDQMNQREPYIIAEIGSNFCGLSDCIASISAAAANGADAVKFQLFTNEALYGFDPPQSTARGSIEVDWLPLLKEKADAVGIDLLCTAFSPELVDAVDPFVARHKVASGDACTPQIINAAVATGKPLIISLGAKSYGDLRNIVELVGAANATWLYCVASYPARMIDLTIMADLRRLIAIAGRIPEALDSRLVSTGFSDHSRDIIGHPVHAAELGADVIEKHVTAFPELMTPDRPHSLTMGEFKIMVDTIRGKRERRFAPVEEERAMLLRHNRRLIATRDIAAGEELRYDVNFGAYRSLKDDVFGYSPFVWWRVHGCVAKGEIKRGASIGPGSVVTERVSMSLG